MRAQDALHPDDPERLYQQNHCGVYRTDDGGRQWTEITADLPSDFGFPMAVHPHDPTTVLGHPAHGDGQGPAHDRRAAAVWRSRDRGDRGTR